MNTDTPHRDDHDPARAALAELEHEVDRLLVHFDLEDRKSVV